MTSSLRSALFTAALLAFVATPAQAALIDFTNQAAWGGANGTIVFPSSTPYDGVKVTISSTGPGFPMTFNSAEVDSTCVVVTGLSCQGDGIGIGDDEVTWGNDLSDQDGTPTERLYVHFFDSVSGLPVPVNISSIGFLDLFGVNTLTGDTAPEMAKWVAGTIGGPVEGSWLGTDTTTTLGYGAVAPNISGAFFIMFFTAPSFPQDPAANSDFALASLSFTREQALNPVPEPATLLLTGAGLAAAFKARRRRA